MHVAKPLRQPLPAQLPHADIPNVGNLIAYALNPSVAMVNEFQRQVTRDPLVLVSPLRFAQASVQAGMVGWASALWGWQALTQPVGVTAGLIPRGY